MRRTYFLPGNWNAICDRCGKKLKSSQLSLEWTGHMVCSVCWEPRHPQDYVRGIPDNPGGLPWTRPEPPDVFVGGGVSPYPPLPPIPPIPPLGGHTWGELGIWSTLGPWSAP